MEIKTMSISDIKPSEYNPRVDLQSDDHAYKKIRKSIEHFGLVEPIVVNKNTNTIIGGHQRYKVLHDLGYDEIPVSLIDVNEKDEKVLNIALNKIEGEFDTEKLKDVLEEIDTGSIDVELSGFDLSEIERMMTAVYQEFSNDEIDLDEYDDENYKYVCPECDFHFNE